MSRTHRQDMHIARWSLRCVLAPAKVKEAYHHKHPRGMGCNHADVRAAKRILRAARHQTRKPSSMPRAPYQLSRRRRVAGASEAAIAISALRSEKISAFISASQKLCINRSQNLESLALCHLLHLPVRGLALGCRRLRPRASPRAVLSRERRPQRPPASRGQLPVALAESQSTHWRRAAA